MISRQRPVRKRRKQVTGAVRHTSEAKEFAQARASTLMVRVPAAMNATRASAGKVTSALQTLPDRTLRWLAATSVDLGAGFYLAGAPRLVVAAGVAPALFMGAAIALRPSEPGGVRT